MKKRSWRSVFRLPLFPPPKKRVAITVPISSRPELTEAERTSLRHLQHYLGHYDIFFIAPRGSSPDLPADANIIRFPDQYFGSNVAHSLLQLSPVFYEQFIEYEFILMYHLDALVFSDQLALWCDKGFDYIGAPWFKTKDTPWVDRPEVGNSGFALMNVRSFLRVLYSRRPRKRFKHELARIRQGKADDPVASFVRALRWLLPINNNVGSHIDYMISQKHLSDLFWSRAAKRYYPAFKIATIDEALLFAFEVDPAGCYDKTSGQLPFGCHAWEKFDPLFWEPFLLREQEVQEPAR